MNPILTAQHILGNIGKYSKDAILNALNTYGNNQIQGVQAMQETRNLPFQQAIAIRNADPRIKAMNDQMIGGISGGVGGNGTKLIRVGDKLVDISTLSKQALADRQFGLTLQSAKKANLVQISPRKMIIDALAEAVKK